MAVGKARVLGSNATIFVRDGSNNPCKIGEVDKFTAKKSDELKKSRPLGVKEFASQIDDQGWELSFEGGKVDWNLAALIQAQIDQYAGGGRSAYFEVVQSILFYNGEIEEYTFSDVTIHGYNLDVGGSGDELQEKFEAFAARRKASNGKSIADVGAQYSVVAGLLANMTSQVPGGVGSLVDKTAGTP